MWSFATYENPPQCAIYGCTMKCEKIRGGVWDYILAVSERIVFVISVQRQPVIPKESHWRTSTRTAIFLLSISCFTSVGALAQERTADGIEKSTSRISSSSQLIAVEKDVKLEVLDWGGTGRPVVLLAGLGDTAHVYDEFAPKLVPAYHVYGITRRGYGSSSKPQPSAENYSADRLAEDVLEACRVLRIGRPVLIGHSLAGEELSSIGSRHPEKVAGLIYLEAGYAYAYYDAHATEGDPLVDMAVARREMEELASPISPRERKVIVQELLDIGLPRLERELRAQQQHLRLVPDTTPAPPDTPEIRFGFAIQRGVQEFTGVKCPVLAIFAVPSPDGSRARHEPSGSSRCHIARSREYFRTSERLCRW